MPKLYEIPEDSKLRVEFEGIGMQPATFHHIDGMYSYCTLDNKQDRPGDEVFHLSASTPMRLCEDGVYEIES